MAVVTRRIRFETQGNTDVVDITSEVLEQISSCDVQNGIVTISVIGSTGAVTTCEYEPGLVKDIPDLFDRLIPRGGYHHDRTWNDDNGHSHLRASWVGPSLTLPFSEKKLLVGTWQQIVFIEFDTRPRNREMIVQILGE